MYNKYNKRRRTRKFVSRKKFTAKRKVGNAIVTRSNYGFGASFGYNRRKKTSARAYRARLYRSTVDNFKWRSTDTETGQVTCPASTSTKRWANVPIIPDSFFTAPKLINNGLGSPTFDLDLVIRGGMTRLLFYNEFVNDTVRIEVYKIFVTDPTETLDGILAIPPFNTVPAQQETNLATDPTTFLVNSNDFSGHYKVMSRKQFTLGPKQTVDMTEKIRVQKLDRENFGSNIKRMFYIFSCESAGDDSAPVVNWSRSCSLSFTGDNKS